MGSQDSSVNTSQVGEVKTEDDHGLYQELGGLLG